MGVAHRHGIIHCDIKPKNILIDKLGEPRLIDFGMARLRHAWSDRVHPTWGGTLAYMAPEQARLESMDRPSQRHRARGSALLPADRPGSVLGQRPEWVWDRARRCASRPMSCAPPRSLAGWSETA